MIGFMILTMAVLALVVYLMRYVTQKNGNRGIVTLASAGVALAAAILLCSSSVQAAALEQADIAAESNAIEIGVVEESTDDSLQASLQYESLESPEVEESASYNEEKQDLAAFDDTDVPDIEGVEKSDITGQDFFEETSGQSHNEGTLMLPEDVETTEHENHPAPELPFFASFVFEQFSNSIKEITAVLQDGETTLLALFPNLERLDARGSTNYAEIFAWATAHPDVELIYSTRLPNGESVQIESETVRLFGTTETDLTETLEILSCLPNLRVIDLGAGEERTDISPENIAALRAALPNVMLRGDVLLSGEEIDILSDCLDLQNLSHNKLEEITPTLELLTDVKQVFLGTEEVCDWTWEDIEALCECWPNAVFDYAFSMYGKEVNLADEVLDLNHIKITDAGETVRLILPMMRNCKVLDMDSCGLSNEQMAAIRDENQDVEVVWRVWFGEAYSVRTNVTKILASMPSVGGRIHDSDGEQLKYCTKVRYLDLGHNADLSDFSFVTYMPELEVAVISMTHISDLQPFACCSNLKYLEAGNCRLSDLSPLAECKSLRHLNVGTNIKVQDITPLYDLNLKRLWLGIGDPVPEDQIAMMRELHPDCIVNTTVRTGLEEEENAGYVEENWKSYQRYLDQDWLQFAGTGYWPSQRPLGWWKVVFKCFGYNLGQNAYAFSWNDPQYNPHEPGVAPVNTQIWDTSFLDEDFDIDAAQEIFTPDILDDLPGVCLYESIY